MKRRYRKLGTYTILLYPFLTTGQILCTMRQPLHFFYPLTLYYIVSLLTLFYPPLWPLLIPQGPPFTPIFFTVPGATSSPFFKSHWGHIYVLYGCTSSSFSTYWIDPSQPLWSPKCQYLPSFHPIRATGVQSPLSFSPTGASPVSIQNAILPFFSTGPPLCLIPPLFHPLYRPTVATPVSLPPPLCSPHCGHPCVHSECRVWDGPRVLALQIIPILKLLLNPAIYVYLSIMLAPCCLHRDEAQGGRGRGGSRGGGRGGAGNGEERKGGGGKGGLGVVRFSWW